jgi:hypothetical protein
MNKILTGETVPGERNSCVAGRGIKDSQKSITAVAEREKRLQDNNADCRI